MAQTEYLVIVEKYESGTFGAYVPELPGIGVAGETEDEVRDLVGEAIRLYLDELDRSDDRGSASVVVSHYTVAVRPRNPAGSRDRGSSRIRAASSKIVEKLPRGIQRLFQRRDLPVELALVDGLQNAADLRPR